MPTHRLLPVAFLALLVVAAPARADRVVLKNGRVVEGEVREEADAVVVRTSSGIEARLPRDQVVRIEAGPTREARAEERLAALEPTDLQGHLALARACDADGLGAAARRVRERVLERWPDEPETRRALGHVHHEGRWITRAEYMAGLGLVPADEGRTWTSPDDAARREAEARGRAQAPALRRLLARASRDAEVAAVRSEVAAFDDLAATPVLVEHVTADSLLVRLLAIEELGRRRAAAAAPALVEAAVEDPRAAARAAALGALRALPADPRVPAAFVRALGRDHVFHRAHAADAIAAFPSRKAVPALITVLRESTAGFGRAHVTIETQRAYIQDFELTSGGTGQTVAEVADPVVGVQSEGTSLDARVVQWERTVVLRTLHALTGQPLGPDPDAWERWWRGARDEFALPR